MARAILPAEVRLQIKTLGLKIRHFGFSRYCPVCRSHLRRFEPFEYRGKTRDVALCPVCGSIERQRLIWLYMNRKTDLFEGRKKLLHVAPEKCFSRHFMRSRHIEYLSADLFNRWVMEKMDLTDIHHPDNTFDAILVSHVLQEIPDDRKAIRELFRVCKPGGWAILHQYIDGDRTIELDMPHRMKHPEQGLEPALRYYGRDFKDRVESAGFKLRIEAYGDEFDAASRLRLGFGRERDIYFCQKI